MDDYVASASSVMAAIMQMLGMYYQGYILEDFSELIKTMGALFYTVGLAMGICSVAIFGNYRRAIYFAIAPALFFAMLDSSVYVNVKGVEVKFGVAGGEAGAEAEKGKPEDLKKIINKAAEGIIRDKNKERVKLSWFFVEYDRLVSAVINRLISLLINEENKGHIIAAAREQMLSHLLDIRCYNPDCVQLLSYSIIGECSTKVLLDKYKQTGKANTLDMQTIGREYPAQLSSATIAYLRTFSVNENYGTNNKYIDSLYIPNEDDKSLNIFCSDLWDYTWQIAKFEAEYYIDNLRGIINAQYADKPNEKQKWNDALNMVINGVTDKTPGKVNDSADPTDEKFQQLAAILIKNTTRYSVHGSMLSQLLSHNPAETSTMQLATSIAGDKGNVAQTAKWTYWASAVRYLQGFFLMIMAMIFPFFCLFLLIPSKATGFFIWLSVWAWLKSWDLGFAVIVVIKEFLIQFLVRTPSGILNKNEVKTGQIFHIMSDEDISGYPFFYTALVSLLEMSVPLLTSYLCLGAGNVLSIFGNTTNTTAGKVYDNVFSATGRTHASAVEQRISEDLAKYVTGEVQKATYTDDFKKLQDQSDASAGQYLMAVRLRAQNQFNSSQHAHKLQNALVVSDNRMNPKIMGDYFNNIVGQMNWAFAEQYYAKQGYFQRTSQSETGQPLTGTSNLTTIGPSKPEVDPPGGGNDGQL